MLRLALLVVFAATLAGEARATCVGDCNADTTVAVDEILLALQVTLGAAPLDGCAAVDRNLDGEATVDEILAAINVALDGCPETAPWRFTEVGQAAGVAFEHHSSPASIDQNIGGVAVADVDADGWLDVFAVGGDVGGDRFFRNRGDGTFADESLTSGLVLHGRRSAGPAFADIDGDGDVDAWIGGVDGSPPHLLANQGDGRFVDATTSSGLAMDVNVVGAAFGDCDGDGDLDLALAHWGEFLDGRPSLPHLWHNDGAGRFAAAPSTSGVEDLGSGHPEIPEARFDWTFTPNFVDLDADGDADLSFVADYRSTRVFLNRGDCTYVDVTTAVISDENGMGSTFGDYDGDGDLDWFVTSILDPDGKAQGHWGVTGNRLYRNEGGGAFTDATAAMGVVDGGWGWAACTADFDNDGYEDVFHVNGFGPVGDRFFAEFQDVPARLFLNQRGEGFVEEAARRGIDDRGSGRGVACADYDRDGDVDVFISNHDGPLRLYRNDGGDRGKYLQVRVVDANGSPAIGARIEVVAGGRRQVREMRAGNNYVSQDPPLAHFGLGGERAVEELRVIYRGRQQSLGPVDSNRLVTVVAE